MPNAKTIYRSFPVRVHPAFAGRVLDPGCYKALSETEKGIQLEKLMKSQAAVLSLTAAQIAAPSRPPLIALHRMLKAHLGDDAFSNEMKRLSGRYARQVLEELGFKFKRSGVPAVVDSPYGAGSTYTE